jgi:hypothetical protein
MVETAICAKDIQQHDKENKMATPVEEAVELYKQWLLGATKPRRPVLPQATFKEGSDRNYSLKNNQFIRYLQWEKQTFGINLGWTDDATNETGDKRARWFFARQGNGTGPIRFGETIAIGFGIQPSFIRFKQRTVGINLEFSKTPSFEWRLLGGRPGTPVQTQEWIAIYNEKSEGGEPLMYFDRDVGGDIGWPSSKRWLEQLTDKLWEEVKKAAIQLLIEGAKSGAG